jgi:hypothetical protein
MKRPAIKRMAVLPETRENGQHITKFTLLLQEKHGLDAKAEALEVTH